MRRGGGGVENVFVCMEDPPACAEWQGWTFPGTAGPMERTAVSGGEPPFGFISMTTCLPMCLSYKPLPSAEETIHTYRKLQCTHTQTRTHTHAAQGLQETGQHPVGPTHLEQRGIQRPGALRRGTLARVGWWSHLPPSYSPPHTHTHEAPGKQPADRKSSLSNTSKTMTSDLWPPSQQISPTPNHPQAPQRETETWTHVTFAQMVIWLFF